MTYAQTISLLAAQLQDANQTISRQAEILAQQQRALCQLAHELRTLRAAVPSADPPPFPHRALRHGSPA